MRTNDPIVWIDCEMTGLDLANDALIEVAVIVTDSSLTPLAEGLDILITPPAEAIENMSAVVRKMHTDSGLLKELAEGETMERAREQVLAYVKQLVPEPGIALLGGNSVGTDKNFLAREMPELIEHLHYRIIDVSSIKELARRWYPRAFFQAPAKTGNHRALGDIVDSINELRYYREVLFPDGEGPDTETCQQISRDVSANAITVDAVLPQAAH